MNKAKTIIREAKKKVLSLNTSGKLVLTAVLMIVLAPVVSTFAATLPYDPFERYGKTLPWSEIEGWEERKSMILTRTPASHLSAYGYNAQDFARFLPSWSTDTRVHVISDGIVDTVRIGWGETQFSGWGNYVIIDHGNGFKSRYSHLGLVSLTPDMVGQPIRKGTEIGMVSDTGQTTEANLEFAMTYNGAPISAFADGRTFEGEFKKLPWDNNVWETPVDTFSVQFWKYRSQTEQRESDPDNPWDPPYYDPLSGYLENYGYMFPAGMIAEPINAATGNFVHRSVDLDLKTQEGPELKFERFYNSLDEMQGPNGKGWSNSFDFRILPHQNPEVAEGEQGSVLYSVKLADGRGETFKESDEDPNTFTPTFSRETDFSLGTLERLGEDDNYKFKYTDTDKTVYIFNSDRDMSVSPSVASTNWGMIEKITDVNGKSINFEYDTNGNLIKVTNDFAEYIEFEYSDSDFLTIAKDQAGRLVEYSYNFDGRLSEVKKANNEKWNYSYDATGKIKSITDAEGKEYVANTYDESGRVVEQKDGNGGVVTFEYTDETNFLGLATGNKLTKFTDARGKILEYVHNDQNYLISEKLADGSTTSYEYNLSGRIISETDAEGNVTNFERSELGKVTKETRADNTVREAKYNDKGQPTELIDPSGTIKLEYDGNGNLIKKTDQKGRTTNYEYNGDNLVTKITEPDNSVKTFGYNESGQVITEADTSAGTSFEYKYDNAGNRIEIKDILGRITKVGYDEFGNIAKITDPRGYSKTYVKDKNGNVKEQLDEVNAKTVYTSDASENIVKITYANGTTSEFKYDENNNKTEEKDQNGNVTKNTYDDANRNTKTEFFDKDLNKLTEVSNEFDKNGNKIKSTDGKGFETRYEYDELNRLNKVINSDGKSKEYKYNDQNNLAEETDFEGNVFKYEYDELGNRIKETDPLGAVTTFEFDSSNNMIKKTDSEGASSIYFYDSTNQLIGIENALGNQARYYYDGAGRFIKQINFAGEETTFSYDENDNLVKQTDAIGNTQTYEFDPRNLLAKQIDPKGNASSYEYDLVGNKVKEINALNLESKFEYDFKNNLVKFIGENGASVSFEYDGLNRKTAEIDALGNKAKMEYDQNGNVTKVFDKNGNATEFKFDKLNRLVEKINSLGQTDKYSYTNNGSLVEGSDRAGNKFKFEYDKLGRVTKEINSLNFSKTNEYDSLGRLVAESDYKGSKTYLEYDLLGNLIKKTDRDGKVTTFAYDAAGRQTKTTNALGEISEQFYDAAGRLKKMVDAAGGTTSYEYDAVSNVSKVTNPRGFATRFEYDALNRKVATIRANNAVTSKVFDNAGRIVKNIDENGNATSYEYDAANNLKSVTNANNATTSFSYDANGNLLLLTNARGFVTKYKYDQLNRVTTQILPDGNELSTNFDILDRVSETKDANGFVEKYEYDALGRLTKQIDRAGFETKLSYDPNNNLIEQIDRLGNKFTSTYSVKDELLSAKNPLGGEKKYEYDALGRILVGTNERGAQTKFEYDKLGNVVKTIDALNGETLVKYDPNSNPVESTNANNQTTKFVYDAVDRNTQVINALNKSKFFNYDSKGNLVALTDENGNTTNYNYDRVYNVTSQTNALGNSRFTTYDANNNPITQTDENGHTTLVAYDSLDRISKKVLPGGETYSFAFDPNNNLVKQTSPKGNATSFEYDSRDQLIAKADALGNTSKYSYDQLERLVENTDPEGGKAVYHYDAISRLTEVLDANSNRTKYEYDEVGNLLKEVNALGKETKFVYDLLDRNTQETNALGDYWSFKYDAIGNLTEKIDAKNQTTLFNYDAVNRVVSQNSTDDNVNYSYDNTANILKLKNKELTLDYSYDAVYQLKLINDSRGESTSYSYDPAGNRTQIVYPDGKTADYSYNANDLLASLTIKYDGDEVSNANPQNLITNFGYDANLNLISQVNPNRTESTRAYDNADRLIEMNNSRIVEDSSLESFAKYNYELNKNGDRIKETIIGSVDNYERCENEEHNGQNGHNPGDCAGTGQPIDSQILAVVKNYKYDPARQLIEVNSTKGESLSALSQDFNEKYSYDAVGNRTKLTREDNLNPLATGTTTYNYNDINELLSDSKYSYKYDQNGNRLEKTALDGTEYYKFAYNSLDQLVNVDSKTKDGIVYNGNSDNIKDQIYFNFDYKYDGFGRRITKVNNTNYEACRGNIDPKNLPHGNGTVNDNDAFDCDNGTGNDPLDKKANTYFATSIAFYGVDKVDYYYDGHSWETLAEYFDRMSAPEPKNNGKVKPPVGDYFDVHTNLYKVQGQTINQVQDLIIATSNYADRNEIPHLNDCRGNGEHYDDTNWYDCDNGSGNDNKENNGNNTTGELIENFKSNEVINYFHYDGLASVAARTDYNISYNVSVGVVDPTPNIDKPTVLNLNVFEAYGKNDPFSYDPNGEGRTPYYTPEYPYAYGFTDWNNKTYSIKELDTESGNYYYGSRFYDSEIGVWNKQDSYRGTLTDPASRNRYSFVKNNPLNNVDMYGFYDRHYTGHADTDKLVDKNYDYYESEINSSTEQISQHQSEEGRLNGIIPGLAARMNETYWSARYAKATLTNHVQMGGVIGRLAARGYEMDYKTVFNYIGQKIQEKTQVYAVKQTQYVAASNNYYGAVAQRDWHSGMVTQLTDYVGYIKDERTNFDTWVDDVADVYGKTYDYGKSSFDPNKQDYTDVYQNFFSENNVDALADGFGKYLVRHMDNPEEAGQFFTGIFVGNIRAGLEDSQTLYIEELRRQQAEEEAKRGLWKIGAGLLIAAGGIGCSIVTVGVGAAICLTGAAVALTATLAQEVVTADNISIAGGGDGFLNVDFKQGLNTFSDFGLVAGGTLVGAGAMVGIFAPGVMSLSELSLSLMATGNFQNFGMGALFTGLSTYGLTNCLNRIETGADCTGTDYTMIGLSAFGGLSMMGSSAYSAGAYNTNLNSTVSPTTKTYQTYTKTNPTTGEVYTGRTSGTGDPFQNVANRDASHHMTKDGFGPAVLDQSSTNPLSIRGREQMSIDYYGGSQSTGGTSGNAINGISPSNINYNIYIQNSINEFGPLP